MPAVSATAAVEAPSSDGASEDGDGAPSGDSHGEGLLPSECADHQGEACLPPTKFALAMCDGDYPSVALWLFQSGAPWTHAYLRRKTKAVYASASGGSTGDMMPIDEEVVVVRHHGSNNPGGIVVSGAGGAWDVVRWDGSCATVEEGLLGFNAPSRQRNARIVWSRLEWDVREALKQDDTVRQAYIALKRECKGVTMGDVSKKCEKADGTLSKTLAEYVRSHDGIPVPKKLPQLH